MAARLLATVLLGFGAVSCSLIYPFSLDEPVTSAPEGGASEVGPVDLGPPADADVWAAVDIQTDVTAAPDATDPLAPFSTPTLVTAVDSPAGEDDPTLTADMLELYFIRSSDIWATTRASLSAGWKAPQRVDALSSGSTESNPELAADGLTIFFSTTRSHAKALGGLDIFVAQRATRSSPWGALKPVLELNSSVTDANACPTPDLLTVFLASTRSGDYEIYRSARATTSSLWSVPIKVKGINSTKPDYGPWVNAAQTAVYFVSYRTGPKDGEAIWVAARPDAASAFSAPIPVPGLNGKAGDEDPWLSPDMKTIYFAGNRGGSYGLLMATR
jgi:hypothetical protein